MLTLFLIRHAKSSWADPGMHDFDRPLNERGKQNAPVMGLKLAQKGIVPDLILSSTAKRARSTAKRIAKALQYAETSIVMRDVLYHAPLSTWLNEVTTLNSANKTVFMVGHNNGITEFANYLTNGQILNIPTCGIVKIEFDFNTWEMVSKGNGELVLFDYPKLHPECNR